MTLFTVFRSRSETKMRKESSDRVGGKCQEGYGNFAAETRAFASIRGGEKARCQSINPSSVSSKRVASYLNQRPHSENWDKATGVRGPARVLLKVAEAHPNGVGSREAETTNPEHSTVIMRTERWPTVRYRKRIRFLERGNGRVSDEITTVWKKKEKRFSE